MYFSKCILFNYYYLSFILSFLFLIISKGEKKEDLKSFLFLFPSYRRHYNNLPIFIYLFIYF